MKMVKLISRAKQRDFDRAYNFLASILTYSNPQWEKLSIFLNFLIPKLPAPIEPDLSKGILEAIDMESYRAQINAAIKIRLADEDAEIDPGLVSGGGSKADPELDRLSNIIRAFNDQFANIEWKDTDKIQTTITVDIPKKVSADKAYQNAMKQNDPQNARIEHDKALERVIVDMLSDNTELFRQFMDNQSFRKWLADTIFTETFVHP
jgi:type I restriction enzyme, R subunit